MTVFQCVAKRVKSLPHVLLGPVEVDEAYFGGLEKNKHAAQKLHVGGGSGGKTAVVGMRARDTNHVSAKVIEHTDSPTLVGFVESHAIPTAYIYTDEAQAYKQLRHHHESIRHSVGEYVRGEVHTSGIESFWALLKRGYYGTFHKMSPKHLHRYVHEFTGRYNMRSLDTIDIMRGMFAGMVGKRLRYADLIS